MNSCWIQRQFCLALKWFRLVSVVQQMCPTSRKIQIASVQLRIGGIHADASFILDHSSSYFFPWLMADIRLVHYSSVSDFSVRVLAWQHRCEKGYQGTYCGLSIGPWGKDAQRIQCITSPRLYRMHRRRLSHQDTDFLPRSYALLFSVAEQFSKQLQANMWSRAPMLVSQALVD